MLSPDKYYDTVAKDYWKMYDEKYIHDLSMPYPANYIRLQMLKELFKDVKNVVDVGCGDGTPALALEKQGSSVCGFDISPNMIEACASDKFIVADLMKPDSYRNLAEKHGRFDGVVCTGVMPHIANIKQAISNIHDLLVPGGKCFVEFRNKLFSLYTMNRLTAETIAELTEEPFRYRAEVYLRRRVAMDQPPQRPYDGMLAQYHNPFYVEGLFQALDFNEVDVHFYHKHPTLPALEHTAPTAFREAALAMEGRFSYKDPFVSSAFVVVAQRAK